MAKNFFSSTWGGRIPWISALKEHLFFPLWKRIFFIIPSIPSPLSYHPHPIIPVTIFPVPSTLFYPCPFNPVTIISVPTISVPSLLSSTPLSPSSLSPSLSSSLSHHACPINTVTTCVTITPVPSSASSPSPSFLSPSPYPIIPVLITSVPSPLSHQHCHHLCHHHACPIFPVPSPLSPSVTSVPSSPPKREFRAIPGGCPHRFNPIKQHPKDFPCSGAWHLLMMGKTPGKIHLGGQEPAPGQGRSRGRAAALDPGRAGKSQLPAVPRCPGRTWRLRREGPSVTAVTRPEGRLRLLTSASSSCFPLWGCRGKKGGEKPGKQLPSSRFLGVL